ncbi:MAG: RHS repeat protein, partial [Verrucomicrobia bacterium]
MKYKIPRHLVFLKNAPAWSWAFSRQLLALLVMFIMTPWVLATVNPDPGDDDEPNNCEGESGGSGGGHSSYSWYLNVGYAPKSRPTNLNTLASLGSNVHGRPTSFQKRFDDSFSSDPLQRSQVKVLIQQTQFSAALFHPSCVFFDSMMSDFEKIDKPASGGFPAFVHQIVTDDCFTLIDTLPASEGSGWRARVWKKNLAALNKVGTFYDATPFFAHPPLTDITFKRPSATAGDNTLLYLEKQNTGSSIRTITEEAVQVLAGDGKRASLVSKIFLGDGTAGPLLSQENLTYSARGTKLWDYSITREVLESSVTGAGTIGGLTLVKKSFEDYDDFSLSPPTGGARGMKRLMTRIDAFQVPGQLPQTTTYQYVNSPTNAATHGLITSRVNPDGSWKYHEYPLYSATSSVIQAIDYEGWKDVTMANRAQARITTHETLGTNSTSTTRIGGQLIAQKKVTVATQALAGAGSVFNFATGSQAPPLFPIAAEEHFDGSAFHITTTLYYPDSAPFPHKSRIAWVENSDGTAVTYTYATVNNNLVVTMREGAGNRNGVTAGIETQTTYSSGNHPIAEIQKDIASNLTVYTWDTDFSYNGGTDALGRPIKRIFNGDVNDFAIAQYACCGLAFARQRDGSSEEYFRDGLKRVYKVVSKATAASPEVTNFIAINGLTTTRTRNFGGSSSLFLSSSTESIDGLTSSQTLPAEKSNLAADRPTTSSVIVRGAGSTGDTITTTFADGSKSIKSHFLDGQPKSSTGTAVPDVSYDYSAHNDGFGGLRTITTASGVVTTTFEDLLGRKTKVLSTEFGAGEIKYEYFPHVNSAPAGSRTKLMSVTDPDGVVISFAYNSKGERITESRIVPLASGSSTQVSSYAIDYVPNITIHGYNLGVSRVESQSLSGTGTAAVTLRQNYTSTDGLSRGSTSLTGNSLTVVTRPNGSGVRTSTTTRPDGTKDVKTFTHGLLTKQSHLSTTSTVLTEISYLYSPQQQLTGTTDARTGTTTFDWNSDNIPDLAESGKPLGQKNPDGTNLQFSYDVLGRLIRTVNPDSSVTHIAYYPTGLQKARWGSQTNPQWYQYDEQGRMTHLYTWQVAPTLDPASLPASAPAGSTATQWVYQPSSGRLQRKQYADGNGTDYTYTDAGRLKTRTWARTLPSSTTRVNTTYHYTHGFLTLTDYNDNTPDVTMAYDALGRTQTVTQAAQSQITYTYAADFNVDLETIRYDLNADGTYNDFVRVIDRNDFSLGRDTGFKLLAGTTIEHEALYTYHPLDGRLQQVSNPQIPGHQFNYTYEPNSNLLDTINGPVHQVDNTWETNRDVLDIKQNQVASTVISRYDYSVNAIGQRTALAQTGTA